MSNARFTPESDRQTTYRFLSDEGVGVDSFAGRDLLTIHPEALERLAYEAFADVSFRLRPAHLEQNARMLADPEADENERFVARAFLENAVLSALGELPICQDTGTAVVLGERGSRVWTDFDESAALSSGIARAYAELNLRLSQIAPLSMFEERNTGTNLPAQIDLRAVPGGEYRFLFLAKGGGSANKSLLFQKTKSILNETDLTDFLRAALRDLGTAACPPYHLAVVIGGASAEETMKHVKLASAGALDALPDAGDETGRPFRDRAWEKKILRLARETGYGAQFGGRHFCHDVRVVRLARHAASCPIGLGVSCYADRNVRAKITPEGLFLERLEEDPARFLSGTDSPPDAAPEIDLDRPMPEILARLREIPLGRRVRLSGTLVVARDAAHARLLDRLRAGRPLPDYLRDHPVYYAGPAKTPAGRPCGSFGPTTAQRMDPYAERFMAAGASLVTLAKGNRSPSFAAACRKYGGYYLGTIGGPAALIADRHVESVEPLDFPDLGMEALRRIRVRNLPAFLLIDADGNDFYAQRAEGAPG